MPERPVLSNRELRKTRLSKSAFMSLDDEKRAIDQLLSGDIGKGSIPHIGNTPEEYEAELMAIKKRIDRKLAQREFLCSLLRIAGLRKIEVWVKRR